MTPRRPPIAPSPTWSPRCGARAARSPTGTTLIALERRFGGASSADSYLGTLRAARYGTSTGTPTAVQRRAFRRELGEGLGWRGRVRAWWALPPRIG